MANIKWSAFPTIGALSTGDTLVGLRSGANVQFSTLTIPWTVPNGGTGLATTTAYSLMATGTTATGNWQAVGVGSTGQLLQSNGASALPSWTTATFPAGSGTLNHMLRSDGTNWVETTATTLTSADVLSGLTQLSVDNLTLDGNTLSSASGVVNLQPVAGSFVTMTGTNDTFDLSLISTNAAGFPALNFYRDTSTSIGRVQAGLNDAFNATGDGFFISNPVSAGKIFLRDSTGNALTISAGVTSLSNALGVGSGGLGITTTPSNGFVPIGNGSTYTSAALTAGSGIDVVNGAGTITISSTANGVLTWNGVAGTTQAAAVNNGYIIQNASQTTVTLPATAVIGSIVAVQGLGAAGWKLTANTGQTIKAGSSTTSSAGSLTSVNQYDSIQVVCIVADTTWSATQIYSSGLTIT